MKGPLANPGRRRSQEEDDDDIDPLIGKPRMKILKYPNVAEDIMSCKRKDAAETEYTKRIINKVMGGTLTNKQKKDSHYI